MKRRWFYLVYFVRDAWDACVHSKGVHLLATGTLCVALFLSSLLLIGLANLETALENRLRDVRVEVYLLDDVDEAGRQRMERRLAATDGVERVEYVDPAMALARFGAWERDGARLLAELDGRSLPASFEIVLRPGADAERRASELAVAWSSRPGVEEVRFDRDWLRRLSSIVAGARIVGGALASVVALALVFVMASVLRLAVYARRDEIDIMLLIGATPSFVRGPFIVSGILQGIVASGVALFLAEVARRLAILRLGDEARLAVEWLAARPLDWTWAGLVVAIGVGVSAVAGAFAVRGRV